MAKIRQASYDPHFYDFWCPGCESHHAISTTIWKFNNDFDKPTIRNSILVHKTPETPLCHSFVTDGRIEFLPDSTHKLAGQTVDLPDQKDWPY